MSFTIRILTPVGEKLSAEVDQVTMTGLEGEFGILEDHTPILAALKEGPASIRQGINERHFALGPGYADTFQNEVTIFTEHAEESHEIDVERAQKALQRSQSILNSPNDTVDVERALRSEQRAENRIEVAKQK